MSSDPSRRPLLVRAYATVLDLALTDEFEPRERREMVETFRLIHADAARRGGTAAAIRRFARECRDLAALTWKSRTGARPHGSSSPGPPLHARSRNPRSRPGRSRSPRTLLDGLRIDVRHAVRSLSRTPAVAIVVVASLALGIGANTVIASLLHSLLLAPLPVADVERLVAPYPLHGEDPFQASALDVRAWQESSRTLAEVGAARQEAYHVIVDGAPRRLEGAAITPGYLETLGVEPALGRALVAGDVEDGEAAVALIGHGMWRSAFGSDPEVIGREIRLQDRVHEIVGVLPPGFDLPWSTRVWVPLSLRGLLEDNPGGRGLFAVGRLAPGARLPDARAELRELAGRLARRRPTTHEGWTVEVVPLRQHLLGDFEGTVEPSLLILLGAVGFLLLITCANVSNLLLARLLGRRSELALRAALGASRGRVVRQLLVESSLLAGCGGLLGVGLAWWAGPVLMRLSPVRALALGADLLSVELAPGILAFAALLTLGTGLVLGILPALQVTGASPARLLRERGGRVAGASRDRRLMRGLVVAEVALALTLVVGAGLLLNSFRNLRTLDPGFDPRDLLVQRLDLPEFAYPDAAERVALLQRILDDVRGLPGVVGAGFTSNVPADDLSWDARYTPRHRMDGDRERLTLTADRQVTAGYLETLAVELVAGRLLEPTDDADARPVVVVTEDLAERAWPDDDPLGKQVKRGDPDAEGGWRTVVGVVRPVKEDRAAYRRTRPAWYLPYAQVGSARSLALVVRVAGDDPLAIAPSVRAVVGRNAPGLPVYGDTTMAAQLSGLTGEERFTALLIGSFAALGLGLAALGIYGILSYAVSSRRREIGVRLALGADAGRVLRETMAEGMAPAVLGLALGVAGCLVVGRLLRRVLFGVSPLDPLVLAAALATASAVAAAACWLPARRATAMDPADVLREE